MNENHHEEDSSPPAEITPLTIAFQHVVDKLSVKGMTAALYEETLTSFLFGGLVSSFPLIAEQYGHPESARTCSWKQFSKAKDSDPQSEAASGADFALVLWHSQDKARVAVFQAKRARYNKRKKRIEIDINQVPENAGDRRTQFAMLVATGQQFEIYRAGGKCMPTTELVVELEDLWPVPRAHLVSGDLLPLRIRRIHWIHYLAYYDRGPKCLAIKDVGLKAVDLEFQRIRHPNWVDLSNSVGFVDLLKAGIKDGAGWFTLNADQLKQLLPSLIHIAPVLVVDESGGGVDLKMDGAEVIEQEFVVEARTADQAAALNAVLDQRDTEDPSGNDGGGSPAPLARRGSRYGRPG